MKMTIVLTITSVCVAGGAMMFIGCNRSTQSRSAVTEEPVASEVAPAAPSPRTVADSAPVRAEENRSKLVQADATSRSIANPAVSTPSLPYQQAVSKLVSSQASFEQKQTAWKQLKDSGKLDQAITDLEQQATANPNSAEYPAALGQACLQKAGTLTDIREQGILGLKADQSFDAALNLDPSNWEAGFWKAAAMSYWPPQLGKGKEVIERFVSLVNLQETQATQPQFAQTYVLLGEQYQKQGYPEYARQTWQRGATLFPNDSTLAQKLTQPATEQAGAR